MDIKSRKKKKKRYGYVLVDNTGTTFLVFCRTLSSFGLPCQSHHSEIHYHELHITSFRSNLNKIKFLALVSTTNITWSLGIITHKQRTFHNPAATGSLSSLQSLLQSDGLILDTTNGKNEREAEDRNEKPTRKMPAGILPHLVFSEAGDILKAGYKYVTDL